MNVNLSLNFLLRKRDTSDELQTNDIPKNPSRFEKYQQSFSSLPKQDSAENLNLPKHEQQGQSLSFLERTGLEALIKEVILKNSQQLEAANRLKAQLTKNESDENPKSQAPQSNQSQNNAVVVENPEVILRNKKRLASLNKFKDQLYNLKQSFNEFKLDIDKTLAEEKLKFDHFIERNLGNGLEKLMAKRRKEISEQIKQARISHIKEGRQTNKGGVGQSEEFGDNISKKVKKEQHVVNGLANKAEMASKGLSNGIKMDIEPSKNNQPGFNQNTMLINGADLNFSESSGTDSNLSVTLEGGDIKLSNTKETKPSRSPVKGDGKSKAKKPSKKRFEIINSPDNKAEAAKINDTEQSKTAIAARVKNDKDETTEGKKQKKGKGESAAPKNASSGRKRGKKRKQDDDEDNSENEFLFGSEQRATSTSTHPMLREKRERRMRFEDYYF